MYAKTHYYEKLFNIDYQIDVSEAKYIWITQLAALQPLPKGWTSEIDQQKRIEYFYQIDSQSSQWENPNEQFFIDTIQCLRQNASDFKKNSIEQHFNQKVPSYVVKYISLMCYYQIKEFKQPLCPQIAVFLMDEKFRERNLNIEFIKKFDEEFQAFQSNMRRKQREELQNKSTIFPPLTKDELKFIPYEQALLFDLQTYKLTLINENRFREQEYCINNPNTHIKYSQPPRNKAKKAHHFVEMFREVLGNPPEITEFYCVAHYMAKFLPTHQVSKPALHLIEHAKAEALNLNLAVRIRVNNMNGDIDSTINGKPTSINFCCAAAGYRLDIGELSDHLSVKLDRLALKPGPPDFQSRLYLEEAFKKLVKAQKQIMSDLDRIGINMDHPLRNIEEGFPAMSLNEACGIIYQCFTKLQQTRKGIKLHLYVK